MKGEICKLEILSPAGNPECFYADINSGADAIYLGLSSFNARMKAENFTEENIREYVKIAHTYGVKIYVTVNTLIEDNDFESLIKLIKNLVNAKVDAFIVQDLGVAYILKNCFKNIVLHASTQMGIHNLDGALVAERMGFKRIVLSRETKLEDIKLIREHTSLEIEYFVQGALCVAFSGNCYLSSLEKGQSGNEGKCLQLCRLPYFNSLTNKNSYNLSARDLGLLENLPMLIEAGVTSFKIEGRMRHSGYCGVATKIYRTAIDKILNKTFSKEWIEEAYEKLRETFSRGKFNKLAYLPNPTPDNIINSDYQNHIGLEIGKVLSVSKFKDNLYKVKIFSTKELHEGDGLKIINTSSKEQVASLGIGNLKKIQPSVYEIITKYEFKSGLSVFLTQNSSLENEILSLKRRIPINVQIIANSGEKLKITIYIANGLQIEIFGEDNLQKAKNLPLSETEFYNQFNKINDSAFVISSFSFQSDGIFLPKSKINEIRRNTISKICEKIIEKNESNEIIFDDNSYNIYINKLPSINPKNIAIVDENFEFKNNKTILNDFDYVVFAPKKFVETKIIAILCELKEKFALNLPTILNHNDKVVLENILKKLPKNITLFSNNIYGLEYANKYNVIASPLMNIKNKYSLLMLNYMNTNVVCASVEANENFTTKYNLTSFVDGEFPLMTFAHCPFKTIFNNTCEKCSYNPNLTLTNKNLGIYHIKRNVIFNCYFELTKHISTKKSKFYLLNFSK